MQISLTFHQILGNSTKGNESSLYFSPKNLCQNYEPQRHPSPVTTEVSVQCSWESHYNFTFTQGYTVLNGIDLIEDGKYFFSVRLNSLSLANEIETPRLFSKVLDFRCDFTFSEHRQEGSVWLLVLICS